MIVTPEARPELAPAAEIDPEAEAEDAAGAARPRREVMAIEGAVKRRVKDLAVRACTRAPLSRIVCFRGSASANAVALTFDDGPHPAFTEPILDVLARRGVRATFFVLGRQVERHPDLLRAIRDAGHEIGIHGYDHTSRDLAGQARHTRRVLRRHGVTTRLFRPPRGRIDPGSGARLVLGGYRMIFWSFDAKDSMRAEGKVREDVQYGALAAGDIVLLHDDNPICARELDGIITSVRRGGLGLGPASQVAPPYTWSRGTSTSHERQ